MMNAILDPVPQEDPVLNVRAVLEAVFCMSFPNPSARRFLNLKGIHEKADCDLAWYLWFENKPGAYLLNLVDAGAYSIDEPLQTAAKSGAKAYTAHFDIKYYPVPDEAFFADFSSLEQFLRKQCPSEVFDDTGVPTYEGDAEISETLYRVGRLDIALHNEGHDLEMRLTAPYSRTVLPKVLPQIEEVGSQRSGQNPCRCHEKALPDWELSWFLLDMLLKGICFFHRAIPSATVLSEDEPCVSADLSDRFNQPNVIGKERCLWLALRLHAHAHGTSETAPCKSCSGELSRVESLAKSEGDFSPELSSGEQETWVNPVWWRAESYEIDRAAAEFVCCSSCCAAETTPLSTVITNP